MKKLDEFENNRALREAVKSSGLRLAEVLARFNARQVRPIAMRTLKSYLANEGARTRVKCSDKVLSHMRSVLVRGDRRLSDKSDTP